MLKVLNVHKSYGDQVIFDDVSLIMNPGERLGLVGRNGTGKTTLFRMLTTEEKPDTGKIELPKFYSIGHLSQHLQFSEPSVVAEVCQVLGERADEEQYRAEAALMGLGFSKEELLLPASHFSGGYQIRVNLAKVLVSEPNLLLLDEPTNYLDILSVRWLERFLRSWRNEMILITHDREFMRRVTTHSMAVHRRDLRRIKGSVEKLYDQIATDEEVYEKTRVNEEKKRKQEQRFIDRFRSKASKATVVQSRIKALERRGTMEALENEVTLDFEFNSAPFHATTLLTAEGLEFGYEEGSSLLADLSFQIDKGERVAIIGPNGKGKTTLLNLIAGELKARAGNIKSNPNTELSYFGQTNIARLNVNNSIEEEILEVHPANNRTAARGICGLLMFEGDTALKKISVLSGGEKSRVLLGKLLVSPSNLLLLDEPTNHLDIESVEALLEAVEAFPGGVLLVTHSEMILQRIATRLIVFDGGRAFTFEGTYQEFLDRVGWQSERDTAPKKAKKKINAKEMRRRRAEIVTARGKVTAPIKKKMANLEEQIMVLEGDIEQLNQQMVEAANAGEDMADLAKRSAEKQNKVDRRFFELEQASEKLEAVRAQWEEKLKALE